MTAYTRDVGREFWYDFDNQTLWNRTPEVTGALRRGYFDQGLTLDSLADEFRASFARTDHPQQFVDRIQASRQGFLDLGAIQLRIVDAHLEDAEAIRLAFEDFGQGVLFDDRPPRPPGRRVHKMDGTPDTWVGWQRWYASMRAIEVSGGDAARWLHLKRPMGLSWATQTEANPPNDNPSNPGLPAERLETLRNAWMSLSANRLDWAFATHRFRAPTPDALNATSEETPPDEDGEGGSGTTTPTTETGRYAKVQKLLETASGNTQPFHGGQGRFWLKPRDEFVTLNIYGHQLIAEPGDNRGQRSALVKVLKGELAGVPQMPLNQPPLDTQQIQFVQEWIDAGCPQN